MDVKVIEKALEDVAAKINTFGDSFNGISKRFETLDGTLKDFDLRVRTVEDGIKRIPSVSVPGVDGKKFSFHLAFQAIRSNDWKSAGYEKEVLEAAKTKALSEGVDISGGYLVPTEIGSDFIELLRSRTVLDQVGATTLTGLTGSPVEIPKHTEGAEAFWVGENLEITESEQEFGQVNLKPKKVAAIVRISNRLLRMRTSPGVETIVRDDMAKVLARKRDLAGFEGTGGENMPLGIANTPGILTTSMNSVPNIDALYDIQFELENNDADFGNLGWVFNPIVWHNIRKMKDADGKPLIQPDITQPGRFTLFGLPAFKTTQLATNLGDAADRTRIFYGNWSDLVIAEWSGMLISTSVDADGAFKKDQTLLRILMETDFAVRHEKSFCVDSTVKKTA